MYSLTHSLTHYLTGFQSPGVVVVHTEDNGVVGKFIAAGTQIAAGVRTPTLTLTLNPQPSTLTPTPTLTLTLSSPSYPIPTCARCPS